MTLDDADRLAVALQVLRKSVSVDAEAMASVLLKQFAPDVVARGLSHGLGFACDGDAACALAAQVPSAREEAARAVLCAAGMGDLVGEA